MSIRSHIFSVLGYGLIVAGFFAGWLLAGHPKLETFKVLNIIGLSYDILGIIVLSELVTQSERAKSFIVNRLSVAVMQVQFLVPLGAFLGSVFHFGAPSTSSAATLFISIFTWSWVPLLVLERVVVWPLVGSLGDINTRSRAFGLLLLLMGGAIQLVAAFKDLYS